MDKLVGLQPERVFYYFEEIAAVPHGSGNTDAISRYCADVAKNLGLTVIRDRLGNVIIKKPASRGYEDHPTVILQAHMDMVCEKAPDSPIDFEKDGLELIVEGDWIRANGTTLGADDGIGVAMALAILEAEDMAHPALEVVLTVDEEIGMFGAAALDGSLLNGRVLVNLDGGSEGVLTVGCAGGLSAHISLPIEFSSNGTDTYRVTVEGLRGGHSGTMIGKGRLNSNIVMGQFLGGLNNYLLVRIDGGMKDNAIPALTTCLVASSEDITASADAFVRTNRVEGDPDLMVRVERVATAERALTEVSTRRIVDFLTAVPNGVVSMSCDIDGLVQTSLNLGILETQDDSVKFTFGMRSSVGKEKTALYEQVKRLVEEYGGTCKCSGDYPAWEYRQDSVLRDVMRTVWDEMYDMPLEISAVHAGLECGYFSDKLEGLDAVCTTPLMEDIHTSRERLSISSVERVYRYICEVLKRL